MVNQLPRGSRQRICVSHADQQLAMRPFILERDLAQVHGTHEELNGVTRQHRDSQARPNHLAHGIEAANLNSQLQSATERIRFKLKPLDQGRLGEEADECPTR